MKALGLAQSALAPGAGTWFFSSLSLLARFGIGAILLAAWNFAGLRRVSRSEWIQGLGLGIFGGLGLGFQMDGVQHAPASTCAFLTQCYCVLTPAWIAFRSRRRPPAALLGAGLMVMAGVGLLSNVDWRQARLGRGEAETIVASVLFTAQILWLERPGFASNRTGVATTIMFAVVSVIMAPIAMASAPNPAAVFEVFNSAPAAGMTLYMTLFCTLAACLLMNHFQKEVTSTHASLIYGTEPLFAGVCALFLPGALSALAGVDYPNETLTAKLLVGGGLIAAANALVLWLLVPETKGRTLEEIEQSWQRGQPPR